MNVRNAIAKCYFHSPLPHLVRPLRERYRMTTSAPAGRHMFSLAKRDRPSARILIYHRVNDDADPFFPAISTALFEEEMRFLRRHHTVVGLQELMQRLAGESAEPVVAITFDDGYQDNYYNAFPILQKYGLPATIFLTTGGMDTREPLWFEQLALAVRKTTCDCLDQDAPGQPAKRLWTRTEKERLQANDAIFAFLRGLGDVERREWLSRILRQLAFVDNRERAGKLLSWDQVRSMHGRGIDFGGHTVTHPFLSRQAPATADWEVSECKKRIEQELQAPVMFFAYPNGREADFGAVSKDLLRNAGYKAAVTTVWGVNYPSTDPMELRRGQPWEESPALFASKLDWYQLVDA